MSVDTSNTLPGPTRPLSRDDEAAALTRYCHTRDPRLREELVASYLPLAQALANRYRGGSEPAEDLFQVASLGLVKAIDGYVPSRGRSFNAYAVPTILGELRRHFRDRSWRIHLPRGLQELTVRVAKTSQELRHELARAPTVSELCERLDASPDDVVEALGADQARRMMSLDVPQVVGDDESAPVIERIGSEELGYDAVESRLAAEGTNLDDRERRVLELRFENGFNQYEIADVIGVSQMQISRIMRKALKKLLLSVRGEEHEDVSLVTS
ncbi:sigma-70 family RNA polymerase sigma factor [Thermoleophilia bacterium SCSIO 60948]|nr:sigma-70 family RNA polymerase sigma factor [Thermoleophilia bacterium SCSIO 60948]